MGIRCYKCGKEIEKGFVLDEGAGYKICEECAFDSNNVFDVQGNVYSVNDKKAMVEKFVSINEVCCRLNECWETNDTDKGRLIQSVIDRVITPIVVGIPETICRCKDCKHSNEDGTICRYSVGRPVEPEHFCSYGTPRNDEGGIEMNSKDFSEHINKRIEACTSLLGIKADEYATDDRLHNFKVAAEIQNCTPITALAGMMAKHTVSVYDLIQRQEQGGVIPQSLWDEKINDSINYLLLLSALIEEGKEDGKNG